MIPNQILQHAKTLLTGSVLVFICHSVIAQSWETGVSGGLSNYRGDLAPNLKISNVRYSAGANLKYNIDYFSGVRLSINTLNVVGNDNHVKFPLYQQRGTRFAASVLDVAVLYDFNFIPFMHPKELKNWSPYLTMGLGFYNARIKGEDVENLEPEPVGMTLPLGVGSHIALNPKWVINFEFLSRKLFTDRFDLVHDTYNDGTQRGISTNTDWYFSLQMGISYTFYSVKCPDFYQEL